MGFDDNNEDEVIFNMNELRFESEYADAMRDALVSERYNAAFDNAKKLKRIAYSKYKEEIENCYIECANHGVLEALVSQVDRYTRIYIGRGNGRVWPEAFVYLEKLNDMDYIPSFRWLADCYYRGIGCEKDLKKAEELYFEAMLFDYCGYSRGMYMSFHPEIEDYAGDNLFKRLIQCYAYNTNGDADLALLKMAELIMDGRIKEYEPATAYALLKQSHWDDGLTDYRLGECVLYGVGTAVNPIVAKMLLEKAMHDLECAVGNWKNELDRKFIRVSFHEEKDFIEALYATKSLIEQARCEICKMSEYGTCPAYDEIIDEDQLYAEWEKEPVYFIKRSRKDN